MSDSGITSGTAKIMSVVSVILLLVILIGTSIAFGMKFVTGDSVVSHLIIMCFATLSTFILCGSILGKSYGLGIFGALGCAITYCCLISWGIMTIMSNSAAPASTTALLDIAFIIVGVIMIFMSYRAQ